MAGEVALHVLSKRPSPFRCAFVALHGFTGSGLDFESLAHLVGGPWYCPDWPGHGESPFPAYPSQPDFYSLPHHLDIISQTVALARTDGLPVILIGYSMGGRLALHWAIKNAPLLRGLILIGTSPGLASDQERLARQLSDRQLADKIQADGIPAFLHYWQNLPLMRSQSAIPEPWKSAWLDRRANNSALGLAGSLLGVGTGALPALHHSLPELALPTLLAAGEHDEKFCRLMQEMHSRIPAAEFHAIPAAGHAAHVECPVSFADLMASFLKKNNVA